MVWPHKSGFGIRLIRMGCRNRPFYQLGALPSRRRSNLLPDEVIGNVDPIPNENNEIIACVDLKRLSYWMGKGGRLSIGAQNILGMAGWLPIPPKVYLKALENREKEWEQQMISEGKGVDKPEEDKPEDKEEDQFVIEALIARKRIV